MVVVGVVVVVVVVAVAVVVAMVVAVVVVVLWLWPWMWPWWWCARLAPAGCACKDCLAWPGFKAEAGLGKTKRREPSKD